MNVSNDLCMTDQWSPLNPEGKMLYDRNFLLQLQYVAESVVKPAGLPKLPDVILDAVSNVFVFGMILHDLVSAIIMGNVMIQDKYNLSDLFQQVIIGNYIYVGQDAGAMHILATFPLGFSLCCVVCVMVDKTVSINKAYLQPYTGRSGDYRGGSSSSPDFTPSFFRQPSRDKVGSTSI